MKVLFLTYHGFDPGSGISKKMLAQVKGLRQNGHEVHVCSYSVAPDGSRCRYVDDVVIKNYGRGALATVRQRVDLDCVYRYCTDNGIEVVYVRHFMNASPSLVRLFHRLRRAGIKSVMEIPTYPYDQEFHGFPLSQRLRLFVDRLFRHSLARQMEGIVTFSEAQTIFGQRTIRISNGVDLDVIPLNPQLADATRRVPTSSDHSTLNSQPSTLNSQHSTLNSQHSTLNSQHSTLNSQPSTLNLIGVAEVHVWHGYDRLLRGLGEYYATGDVPVRVVFHIVGNVWPSEMDGIGSGTGYGFRAIIEEYGLQDKVVFHGQLFGQQLDEVFAQCQFAVGSLGRHRSGITSIKTLKNREYASRGLPFIYSEQDSDFDHQPYVLKAPADESPINIRAIVGFMQRFAMAPADIRRTVEHLSWKRQMQLVIECLTRESK